MHATTWMNLENMCYVEKARTKGHLLSESMYTKRPEQANSEIQEADGGCQELWGGRNEELGSSA